jgi:hypothetical protein
MKTTSRRAFLKELGFASAFGAANMLAIKYTKPEASSNKKDHVIKYFADKYGLAIENAEKFWRDVDLGHLYVVFGGAFLGSAGRSFSNAFAISTKNVKGEDITRIRPVHRATNVFIGPVAGAAFAEAYKHKISTLSNPDSLMEIYGFRREDAEYFAEIIGTDWLQQAAVSGGIASFLQELFRVPQPVSKPGS